MPQLVAPRGRPDRPLAYLAASVNKKKLFAEFEEHAGTGITNFETFHCYWQLLAPEVVIMMPRADVCYMCDKHREAVRASQTEEGTKEAVSALSELLQLAQHECDYYNKSISLAKEVQLESEPNLKHITFDFAQQLELPQHTRVGPLYFKSRFHVQLFGICDEAACHHVNFIFHEEGGGGTIGQDDAHSHSSNAVLSIVDFYLHNYSEERVLTMHAANYVGQNKNQSVIAYLPLARRRIKNGGKEDCCLLEERRSGSHWVVGSALLWSLLVRFGGGVSLLQVDRPARRASLTCFPLSTDHIAKQGAQPQPQTSGGLLQLAPHILLCRRVGHRSSAVQAICPLWAVSTSGSPPGHITHKEDDPGYIPQQSVPNGLKEAAIMLWPWLHVQYRWLLLKICNGWRDKKQVGEGRLAGHPVLYLQAGCTTNTADRQWEGRLHDCICSWAVNVNWIFM